MGLAAIVAATPAGVIGLDGDMPWRLSSDLRRFKKLTMGCPIVMGRKTYDSIGRPLPGRQTIVLTRDPAWTAAGVRTASVEQALEICRQAPQAYVVGGAEVYRLLLPHCDTVYWTLVWSQVAGDTRLELDFSDFATDYVEKVPQTQRDSVPTEFRVLTRRAEI
ncbi:dihydrofolate reductase [Roseimaritima ulvae]|uniref:Dihydrofolate reductase n=1 Tax=Roseimaritima ulvae TaxID=980254 RepID=A0A5B9QT19_9BACT|nr:dihydrofolate reductase [Roseimaritima ulvae]QEG42164.1 Dihydrofolate reductase type 3 [Roseimaritima ulvae]